MSVIKFTVGDLEGYGFDLNCDRVIRFNKHADGTYLNNRATYSINTQNFTHFEIRTEALRWQKLHLHIKPEQTKFKIWWIFVFIAIVMLAKCEGTIEFNFSSDPVKNSTDAKSTAYTT